MSMYLAQMLDPESTEYSVNTYFEIAGAGEEEVERAARGMAGNHECLRSYYGEENGEPVEFSPVDMTAKAVVTLAGTPDEFTVFHANNCHNIHFANVLEAFEGCGFHIDVVDDETFGKRFSEALSDGTKSLYVSSLIAYDDNENRTLRWTASDNGYTVKALYRLGFSWPVISPVYVRKHLEALATLGFFDLET